MGEGRRQGYAVTLTSPNCEYPGGGVVALGGEVEGGYEEEDTDPGGNKICVVSALRPCAWEGVMRRETFPGSMYITMCWSLARKSTSARPALYRAPCNSPSTLSAHNRAR